MFLVFIRTFHTYPWKNGTGPLELLISSNVFLCIELWQKLCNLFLSFPFTSQHPMCQLISILNIDDTCHIIPSKSLILANISIILIPVSIMNPNRLKFQLDQNKDFQSKSIPTFVL